MKNTILYPLAALLWWGASVSIHAQPVFSLDSGQTINDYISLGEFNTNGNLDGWADQTSGATKSTVANGLMKVTTLAGDPWIFRQHLADLTTELNVVEVRLRLLKGSNGIP